MNILSAELAEYVGTSVKLGGANSEKKLARLRTALRRIQHRNERYLLVAVVMLTTMFAVAMGVIVFLSHSQLTGITVASVFGVSLIGMVKMMSSFWREKLAVELLLELSPDDEELTKRVAAILLDRMSGK